jgi:hypothetical protein
LEKVYEAARLPKERRQDYGLFLDLEVLDEKKTVSSYHVVGGVRKLNK